MLYSMKILAVILLWLLTGCESVTRYYYSAAGNYSPLVENGFKVNAPESWGLMSDVKLGAIERGSGMSVAIRLYEWSPIAQFNHLPPGVRWQDDLTHVDADITRAASMTNIKSSEELSRYNRYDGRGLRKVGESGKRRCELIVFYPEGELSGTRLFVLLYGSPSKDALRELDEVIGSVQREPKMGFAGYRGRLSARKRADPRFQGTT
jgi:hypothetical protein